MIQNLNENGSNRNINTFSPELVHGGFTSIAHILDWMSENKGKRGWDEILTLNLSNTVWNGYDIQPIEKT